MFATSIIKTKYKYLAKPIFFKMDPERIHDIMLVVGSMLGRFGITRKLTSAMFRYDHPSLEQTLHGIHFRNPVGLAAGFDKNAELIDILPSVGFGFEEIGSITGKPCTGNPKPRLWRLPKSMGLVVYYGLKNDGADAIAARLKGKKFDFPISTSIAKTNDASTVETQAGINDYANAFERFAHIGDMFTVNISCPNAFGGEPFSSPDRLDALLNRLDAIETSKPVFIKIACDISTNELDALREVCDRHRVNGFVLCNLTKDRSSSAIHQDELAHAGKGGISGKPTYELSNRLIGHLYKSAGHRYTIIGVGGIFSAEDAYEKIRQGASLVQLITGMIYEGPQLIGEINRGLVKLLRRDGFSSITEAIGSAHK